MKGYKFRGRFIGEDYDFTLRCYAASHRQAYFILAAEAVNGGIPIRSLQMITNEETGEFKIVKKNDIRLFREGGK